MSKVPYIVRAIVIILLLVIAFLLWWFNRPQPVVDVIEEETTESVVEQATTTPPNKVIGTSVEGREIEAYTFGTGANHLLFVGGVHGGYEWNSVVLAETFINQLLSGSIQVPPEMKVSVIPNLNPDGVYKVLGMTDGFSAAEALAIAPTAVAGGRFNANNVDLNRNFDCKWESESTWRGATVSAGSGPFSEPEAVALRDFVMTEDPTAVIFWHSQASNVYASECHDGVLPETLALMSTYASAADYGAVESFDAYPITGDAEGWLASIGIPAITVELETRDSIEWERNLAGIEATVELYQNLAR